MMAESNDTGALLISCGNETEIALGYATLYGDMCGGHLADRRSVEDRTSTGWRATSTSGMAREMIPEDTFDIMPVGRARRQAVRSVRLRRRRRRSSARSSSAAASPADLVTLFDQRALDPTRFAPDDQGRTVYDKYTTESFRSLVHNIARTMRRAVYKRLQGPPIVVVSERAFGFDLRETIINKWDTG